MHTKLFNTVMVVIVVAILVWIFVIKPNNTDANKPVSNTNTQPNQSSDDNMSKMSTVSSLPEVGKFKQLNVNGTIQSESIASNDATFKKATVNGPIMADHSKFKQLSVDGTVYSESVIANDATFKKATVSGPIVADHGSFRTVNVNGTDLVSTIDKKYAALAETIPKLPNITSDGTNPIVNNIKLSKAWTAYTDSAPDKSEISNDTDGFKSLMIAGNRSKDPKGPRKVSLWDDVDVKGGLNVSGTTAMSGDLNVTGAVRGGHLNVDNNLRLAGWWTGYGNDSSEKAEISNDTGTFKSLMIAGNKSKDPTGPRRVSLWDDVEVKGKFNVAGTSTLAGDLDVAGTVRGGHMNVDNNFRLAGWWTGYGGSAPDKAEISNDTTSYKSLMIAGNTSQNPNGPRKVSLWDDVSVNGVLSVGGNSTVAGNSAVSGNSAVTGTLNVGQNVSAGDVGSDNYVMVDSYDGGTGGISGAIARVARNAPASLTQIGTTYPNRNVQQPGCPNLGSWSAICPKGHYQVGMTDSCGISYPICKKFN